MMQLCASHLCARMPFPQVPRLAAFVFARQGLARPVRRSFARTGVGCSSGSAAAFCLERLRLPSLGRSHVGGFPALVFPHTLATA